MPDFSMMGSLMKNLHQEFVSMYYLMLPIVFAAALVATWLRSPGGGIEFLDTLKRTVVATLLLAALPDITSAILSVSEGIVSRIDEMNSLDQIVQMAKAKSDSYSASTSSLLLQFNDLLIATLSFISFFILYFARYLTVAMFHFFWAFLTVSAPLLLLFNVFTSTSHITKNLFQGLIEVASWKIVWAILGAMLTSLSFGDAYQAEGNYLSLIVMNFIIAVSMLATPMLVHSLANGGAQGLATTFGKSAVTRMTGAIPSMSLGKMQGMKMGFQNPFSSGASGARGSSMNDSATWRWQNRSPAQVSHNPTPQRHVALGQSNQKRLSSDVITIK